MINTSAAQTMAAIATDDHPASSILQRFPPQALAALAAELPDLFPEEQLKEIPRRRPAHEAMHVESSPTLLDEQIKTIAAYIQDRDASPESLPELPREALRSLVTIRKYVPTEELIRIEDRILASLRKRFGPFDESALVTFLVKYLL